MRRGVGSGVGAKKDAVPKKGGASVVCEGSFFGFPGKDGNLRARRMDAPRGGGFNVEAGAQC